MKRYPDTIRVYDDFLSEENAYKIYASLGSLPQQWFSLHRSYIDENNQPQKSKTWWNIHGDKGQAPILDSHSRHTHNFLATGDHQTGCTCIYCDVRQLFQQNPPPEAQDLTLNKDFITMYRPGDYFSQNIDPPTDGSWAFNYSLSVGWRPEWGGVLNIQDPETSEWYAFPPMFNRLIMWDVNAQLNYFVSQVISDSPINRLTYSGWWAESMIE